MRSAYDTVVFYPNKLKQNQFLLEVLWEDWFGDMKFVIDLDFHLKNLFWSA